MRKLLFFTTFAALLVLGCSSNDDMPCATCNESGFVYCLISYNHYECDYVPSVICREEVYEGYGKYYGNDYTCGGYWWQSSNPPPSSSSRPSSSSSSRPVSSSSVEYTGGSCNVNDYGRVEIGGQVWMAKNWGCYAAGSKCYNNDPANCNTYGRLYDWATAMNIDKRYNNELWGGSDVNHRGICPSGWHIPSDDEWSELVNYVESYWGCYDCAARYLKSQYGWSSGGNGQDAFGFAALPGGFGNSYGYFFDVGDYGLWWGASENNANSAYRRDMYYSYEIARWHTNSKDLLRSVRCLQD